MKEELVSNQERHKPQDEKAKEDKSKVNDLKGSPMRWGWSYVMKVEKAPMELYSDIGGSDAQIQEIKEAVVELPFTHP